MNLRLRFIFPLALLICVLAFGVSLIAAPIAEASYLELVPVSQTIQVGDVAAYELRYHVSETDPTNYMVVTSEAATTWEVVNPAIASNLGSGQFQGLSEGTTEIRATYARIQATATGTLNVEAAGEPYLEVRPDLRSIMLGDDAQYAAFLLWTDGSQPEQDVTALCTWDIDDPVLANNAGNGLYNSLAVGSTKVRATYEYKMTTVAVAALAATLTDDADLTVYEEEEVGPILEVRPATQTVAVGDDAQYEAFLVWTDGSNPEQNVTAVSYWTIADATIGSNLGGGLYKGLTVGTTKVKASYDYTDPEDPTVTVTLEDEAELQVIKGDEPPEYENLPEGKIIDRQPGYIVLASPQNLGNPGDEFIMTYDPTKMDSNPDRYPKVLYFNDTYQRWVALASYPVGEGQVKAINDGGYSGWFVVFGCIQPKFTDIPDGFWGESIANRMNGLGLLEGYPNYANPSSLLRPCGLDVIITRVEVTVACARILGLAPGETTLYPTLTWMSDSENNTILNSAYTDGTKILPWARPYIAAMTKEGYVSGQSGAFNSDVPMTRIEAAVLISNALRDIPTFGTPADLSGYTDSSDVPSWANGKVAQGTISGYPDGSLRPNQPINRAETLALLLNLLKGLNW